MPLLEAAKQRLPTGTALLLGACMLMAMAGSKSLAAADQQPTESEIQRALKVVAADPNLATERTRRIPSFGDREADSSQPAERDTTWLRELFEWLAETSRALLWVLSAIFGALLVSMLVRLLRGARLQPTAVAKSAPTHVRDLDIRPESLPEHIGAAALELWTQNQHRAALALLYRGLLSRLVHVHALAIRDSTTEAACIELAQLHLQPQLGSYVSQLVRSWQRAVYGGVHPQDEDFHALCKHFDAALPVPVKQVDA